MQARFSAALSEAISYHGSLDVASITAATRPEASNPSSEHKIN
jgi:hypothetical protein